MMTKIKLLFFSTLMSATLLSINLQGQDSTAFFKYIDKELSTRAEDSSFVKWFYSLDSITQISFLDSVSTEIETIVTTANATKMAIELAKLDELYFSGDISKTDYDEYKSVFFFFFQIEPLPVNNPSLASHAENLLRAIESILSMYKEIIPLTFDGYQKYEKNKDIDDLAELVNFRRIFLKLCNNEIH